MTFVNHRCTGGFTYFALHFIHATFCIEPRKSIERYFPDTIKFTRPEGGLFTWIELPEGISARDVLVRSLEKKIAFVPGGSFYPNGNKENTLRINYSNMPEDKIEKGLKTLGEVVKEYISQSK